MLKFRSVFLRRRGRWPPSSPGLPRWRSRLRRSGPVAAVRFGGPGRSLQSPAAPAAGRRQAPAQQAHAGRYAAVCGGHLPDRCAVPAAAGRAPVPSSTWSARASRSRAGSSVVDAQTYLYYMRGRRSTSACPPRTGGCRTTKRSSRSSSATSSVSGPRTSSTTSPSTCRTTSSRNGVIGKMVVYNMEERQRVKIVDYVGSKKVEQSKIDEELKKQNLRIALDSFIDQGLIRKVAGVVREMYAEKGYEYVEVKPEIKPVSTRDQDGQRHLPHHRRPEGEDPRGRLPGQQGDRRRQAERKMKENKGPQPLVRLHHRRRHLQGRQVRRRRRHGPGVLPRARLRQGADRPAGAEDPRRLRGRQDALRAAADPGHRRAALQDRRGRASPATPSSRPRGCARCSRSRRASGSTRRRSARASRRRARSTAASAISSSPACPSIRSRTIRSPMATPPPAAPAGPPPPAASAGPPVDRPSRRARSRS